MEPTLQPLSTYALWQKWAKALQRQFERISEIYEAHEEGAEAEKLRAFIERLKLFIDPVSHAQELAQRNYDVRGSVQKLYLLSLVSLESLFREALVLMPQLSEDMQRLLNSPPAGNCNGRTASDVFKGPHRSENEGIGRGVVDESDRLPWQLFQLLEQAEMGGTGYFYKGLNAGPSDTDHVDLDEHDADHPDRHDPRKPRKRITATGVQ
jgi:hypothetical protein